MNRYRRPSRASRQRPAAAPVAPWRPAGLVAPLFAGDLPVERFFPCPAQSPAERAAGDQLLARVAAFLATHVDAEQIAADGEIPPTILAGLGDLGLFGITIPAEYGGLGLSLSNALRLVQLVATHSPALAALIMTPYSLDLPGILRAGGSVAQCELFLPRLAAGAICALACNEAPAGLLPQPLATTAQPDEGGDGWLLSGEKVWVCNGAPAELLVVIARTNPGDEESEELSAFLVDTTAEAFAAGAECRFMALKGVPIGVARFRDLALPGVALLGQRGQGLAILRQALRSVRLAMAAASCGALKQTLAETTDWAHRQAAGCSESVAELLAVSAADLYAAESLTWMSAALAESSRDGHRLEAAMARLFCGAALRRSADAIERLRGGFSLAGGHLLPSQPLSPLLDETTDGLSRLVAGEVLGQLRQSKAPALSRRNLRAAVTRYVDWGRRLYWPNFKLDAQVQLPEALRPHLHHLERDVRRLGRDLLFARLRYRRRLPEHQLLLGRLVDCATELFAVGAVLGRAALPTSPGEAAVLAELFCRQARQRVGELRRRLAAGEDADSLHFSQELLDGYYAWLTDGGVGSWQAKGRYR